VLDLGSTSRAIFAAAYIATQTVLVLTAGRRPDHAFGFRMFSESATMRVTLLREVESPSGHGTMLVPSPGGTWAAHDREGTLHRFAWQDRVRDPLLSSIDVTVFASYGLSAQLARVQAALDDVAAHTPDDSETRRLVAEVTAHRNGRDAGTVRLASAERPLGTEH